jgi:hypothetical protein
VTVDLAGAWRPLAAGLQAARRADPRRAGLRPLRWGIDLASSLSRQVVAGSDRRSSMPTSSTPSSVFEILSVPAARAAAIALGGSRNDLVVAATARALGRYLERMGQPTDEVCLVSPVRHPHRGGTPNNRFAPVFVVVPTGSTHPVAQFGVVAERLAQARKEPVLPVAAALAPTISRLPTRLLTTALQAEVQAVDFVATALPGLRGARRVCGSTVEESYPFGPRLGCPLNVTGFGNGDRLDVGITLNPTAFPDSELFRDCLEHAFAELTQAAG